MTNANVHGQARFGVRMEWGPVGAAATVEDAGIAVVVDVLSFTTTLTVAVEQGAEVFPYRWRDRSAVDHARAHNATLAVGRLEARDRGGRDQVSLSPSSLQRATGLKRVVLPSPNGSSISFGLAESGAMVVGACLRNRRAAAAWVRARMVRQEVSTVTLVAAGERWGDGSLRPAVEDLWGAGAVIAALADLGADAMSPEARSAAAAFREVESSLCTALRECSGGVELARAGFAEDVVVAADLDSSTCVPVLDGVRFVDAPALGAAATPGAPRRTAGGAE